MLGKLKGILRNEENEKKNKSSDRKNKNSEKHIVFSKLLEGPSLIELCCRCGFVHRDDRIPFPGNITKKLHYHWEPFRGHIIVEKSQLKYKIKATICIGCVCDYINWDEHNFRKRISYYEATLPERYGYRYDKIYYAMTTKITEHIENDDGSFHYAL